MSYGRILFAFVVLGLAASAFAATLVVDLNGGADYTDIQSAIDVAVNGDTVLVKPGEYVITEQITFSGKGITVRGEAGPEATTIRMAEVPTDPNHASAVIFYGETNAAVLEGLKLTGGKGIIVPLSEVYNGGGVFCQDSSPTLASCTISGNSGGGVDCARG